MQRTFGQFDRAYFEQQYRNYRRQNPPRKLAFYRKLAELAVGSSIHPRVLDVGCAFGLFLAHLDSRWERFGMDASEHAIQQAREQVRGVEFAVASDVGGIPYQGPFDLITAFDVLEHIPDLQGMLGMISQSLAPGGAFVFVVPVYDGPTGLLIRALDKDPTHVHKLSREFWLRWPLSHFRLRDWWGIYRYLLPGEIYFHLDTRRWRWCTPAIACLMERR